VKLFVFAGVFVFERLKPFVKVSEDTSVKVVAKLLLGVSIDTHTLSSAELRDLCEVEFWEVCFLRKVQGLFIVCPMPRLTTR